MTLFSSIHYFRDLMKELGYTEWKDPFNFSNIPSNIIHKAFHIQTGSGITNSKNQTLIDMTQSVTIRLFLKGYSKPIEAVSQADQMASEILREALRASRKLTSDDVADVTSGAYFLEPLAVDNDNAMIVNMNFNVRLFLEE